MFATCEHILIYVKIKPKPTKLTDFFCILWIREYYKMY